MAPPDGVASAGEPVTRHELNVAVGGLKTELAALETRPTWRLIGFMAAVNALLVAAVKLIP